MDRVTEEKWQKNQKSGFRDMVTLRRAEHIRLFRPIQ
jgi:hypothetical protein